VHQFEIMERPSDSRPPENPWPTWPMMYRTSSAHEEGGERVYAVNTLEFLGDEQGNLRALKAVEVRSEIVDGRPSFVPVEGSEFELKADLVLLAMGFTGPLIPGLVDQSAATLDPRGNVAANTDDYKTSADRIFTCGDMRRGQSLVVWAIREGRQCARSVDEYLMGASSLPR
jgi:glutamate synthase (NADPH/NADH) small chain